MQTVTIKREVEWLGTYVPPRCRKERWRVEHGSVSIEFKSYTAAEAPVAFRVYDYKDDLEDEIRFADGMCLSRMRGKRYADAGKLTDDCLRGHLPGALSRYENGDVEVGDAYGLHAGTAADLESSVEDVQRSYALVDGAPWRLVDETGYTMTLFGDGSSVVYPELSAEGAAYNALQFDLALAEAERRTEGLVGGEASANGRIEVLLPEAVRADPHRRDMEKELARADDKARQLERQLAEVRADKADAQAALDAYLAETPGAPWRRSEGTRAAEGENR